MSRLLESKKFWGHLEVYLLVTNDPFAVNFDLSFDDLDCSVILTEGWIDELVGRNELTVDLENECLLLYVPNYTELLLQVHEDEREDFELIYLFAFPLAHYFVGHFNWCDLVTPIMSRHDLNFVSKDED